METNEIENESMLHNKSIYLSNYENKCLFERIKSPNFQVLSTVIVEIYSLDELNVNTIWQRKKNGFLCFIKLLAPSSSSTSISQENSPEFLCSINFFDSNFDLKWTSSADEIESFTKLNSYFSYFVTKKHTVGLNFPYNDEAEKFHQVIEQKLYNKIKIENDSLNVSRRAKSPIATKSDFNNNKVQMKEENTDNKKKQTKISKKDISRPTDFKLVEHIGLRQANEFEMLINENNAQSIAIKDMVLKISRKPVVVTRRASDLKSLFFKKNQNTSAKEKPKLKIPPAPEQYKPVQRRKSEQSIDSDRKKPLAPRLSDFFQNEIIGNINVNNLTINELRHLVSNYIDEHEFERIKLSELFVKYLPNFKHSNDWINAFSLNELKTLIKVEDEKFYGTRLENLKSLISKWPLRDSYAETGGLFLLFCDLAEEQSHDFEEILQINEERKIQKSLDDRYCKICMELPMDCAYFECRHMCSCMKCSEKLDKCPVCRQPITQRVKIIIS